MSSRWRGPPAQGFARPSAACRRMYLLPLPSSRCQVGPGRRQWGEREPVPKQGRAHACAPTGMPLVRLQRTSRRPQHRVRRSRLQTRRPNSRPGPGPAGGELHSRWEGGHQGTMAHLRPALQWAEEAAPKLPERDAIDAALSIRFIFRVTPVRVAFTTGLPYASGTSLLIDFALGSLRSN